MRNVVVRLPVLTSSYIEGVLRQNDRSRRLRSEAVHFADVVHGLAPRVGSSQRELMENIAQIVTGLQTVIRGVRAIVPDADVAVVRDHAAVAVGGDGAGGVRNT